MFTLPSLQPHQRVTGLVGTAPLLPQALVCDLDGTLVDTMPRFTALAIAVLGDLYGMDRAAAREAYVVTCGLPFVEQLELIQPGDARNAEASATFERRKRVLCEQARMPADTVAALGWFQRQGVRVVISSNNGADHVEDFAARSRGSFQFDLALGFGDGLAKGAPHLDRIAGEYGLRRDAMLFVGDSLHDGELAERERVPFVGVAGTFSRDRFRMRFPRTPVVSRFADLAPYFLASGRAY